MEFKKSTRYDRGRPQRHTPQPGDSRPIAPLPVQHPTTITRPSITHTATPSQPPYIAAKTTVMSYVRQSLFTKKAIIISIIVVIIIAGLIAGLLLHQNDVAKNSSANTNPKESVEDLEYQTILPDGKSINEFGGWRRVSPSESDPVYAYNDKIGDISINVSEQPLPKSFIGDVDNQVAELAKKFNATTEIGAGSIKIYVGISANGPQSAIFTKNSLLILIKSQEKVDDAAWATYIKSLN